MTINIDDSAGFCWGVVRTIDIVEGELDNSQGKDVYQVFFYEYKLQQKENIIRKKAAQLK